MKQIGSFTRKLVACGAALLAASLFFEAQAETWTEGQARVLNVQGSAQYSTGGGVWVPLRRGDTLEAGTSIRTAAESHVVLTLGRNGRTLRVSPVTTVTLDRLAFRRFGGETVIETQLNLQSGQILGQVDRLASASRYEVKTPNAVAGVRGSSRYRVSTRPVGDRWESEFTSLQGTMVIADASVPDQPVTTVTIDTGESYITGVGVRPVPPGILDQLNRELDDVVDEEPVTTPAPEPIVFIEPEVSPIIP